MNALKSHKSLYDLVVLDSMGTEKNFAESLEREDDVVVYTKLPNGFIYFVAETKGYDKDSLKDYRRAESVKIECASRHFATISDSHVTYDVVKNYDELWDIITKP